MVQNKVMNRHTAHTGPSNYHISTVFYNKVNLSKQSWNHARWSRADQEGISTGLIASTMKSPASKLSRVALAREVSLNKYEKIIIEAILFGPDQRDALWISMSPCNRRAHRLTWKNLVEYNIYDVWERASLLLSMVVSCTVGPWIRTLKMIG